jgi:hypothetical protein
MIHNFINHTLSRLIKLAAISNKLSKLIKTAITGGPIVPGGEGAREFLPGIPEWKPQSLPELHDPFSPVKLDVLPAKSKEYSKLVDDIVKLSKGFVGQTFDQHNMALAEIAMSSYDTNPELLDRYVDIYLKNIHRDLQRYVSLVTYANRSWLVQTGLINPKILQLKAPFMLEGMFPPQMGLKYLWENPPFYEIWRNPEISPRLHFLMHFAVSDLTMVTASGLEMLNIPDHIREELESKIRQKQMIKDVPIVIRYPQVIDDLTAKFLTDQLIQKIGTGKEMYIVVKHPDYVEGKIQRVYIRPDPKESWRGSGKYKVDIIGSPDRTTLGSLALAFEYYAEISKSLFNQLLNSPEGKKIEAVFERNNRSVKDFKDALTRIRDSFGGTVADMRFGFLGTLDEKNMGLVSAIQRATHANRLFTALMSKDYPILFEKEDTALRDSQTILALGKTAWHFRPWFGLKVETDRPEKFTVLALPYSSMHPIILHLSDKTLMRVQAPHTLAEHFVPRAWITRVLPRRAR